MIEFAQTISNVTEASNSLYDLIEGANLIAYPESQIRLAVSRAVAVEGARGWKISKEKQSHKIDIVIALAQACLGAVTEGTVERRVFCWAPGPPLRELRGRDIYAESLEISRSRYGY